MVVARYISLCLGWLEDKRTCKRHHGSLTGGLKARKTRLESWEKIGIGTHVSYHGGLKHKRTSKRLIISRGLEHKRTNKRQIVIHFGLEDKRTSKGCHVIGKENYFDWVEDKWMRSNQDCGQIKAKTTHLPLWLVGAILCYISLKFIFCARFMSWFPAGALRNGGLI